MLPQLHIISYYTIKGFASITKELNLDPDVAGSTGECEVVVSNHDAKYTLIIPHFSDQMPED